MDAGDEVERAGQELKSYEACDLGDLLVAVAVPAQTFDVSVPDLGRRHEDPCAKATIAAISGSLDVPWRASWISLRRSATSLTAPQTAFSPAPAVGSRCR
jgi:hypothetical protein